MRFILIILGLLILTPRAFALPILHRMTCAGYLDPAQLGTMDSLDYSLEKHANLYRIAGRLRRVSIVTTARYGTEGAPARRIEAPVVDARRPGLLARVAPALRYALDGNRARALRVLFTDPVRARVTERLVKGVPRFTYHLASGADANVAQLRELAIHLYARGYGRHATFGPNPRAFQIVLGRRVYSGSEFYAMLHEANMGTTPPRPRGWAGLRQYLIHLNVAQLVRNPFLPAEDKVGFRPRFEYDADVNGDLTPARLTEIATDLEERTELQPDQFDVLVAGRAFSGLDFIELHRRMHAGEIVSIDAERGLAEAGRAGRWSVLMDNVAWATARFDASDIVVLVKNTRAVATLAREFDARFGMLNLADVGERPLVAASREDLRIERVASFIEMVTNTVPPRHFERADDFLDYYDPRRLDGFADGWGGIEDVAVVAHAYFAALRANLPEFYRLAPDAEQRGRLRALAGAFEGYEFIPFADDFDSSPFAFAAVRRAP